MAWLFFLDADCVNEDGARAFGRHFVGLRFALPDGRGCNVESRDVSTYLDEHGHFRCSIELPGARQAPPDWGLRSDDERRQLALFLYRQLQTAPSFRFCVIGIETYDFDPLDRNGAVFPRHGLVISEQMFEEYGSPEGFSPFATGYRWVPLPEAWRG